ncbi:hypothetical protein [Profundibacterium mesophilum]|uniref:Uncharacterized protein n=1 Tax=Profundibacterium mesophilum KAUST100406-0324 TaxID=1037889 RepID=A0A921NS57_9RHOB|nr:hypothetical protein [Profundibacterium mesophilum]KAF0676925.1 hypothetical protein PMES_00722 [Profundibacterium mesophilum KAUST100406-0324]
MTFKTISAAAAAALMLAGATAASATTCEISLPAPTSEAQAAANAALAARITANYPVEVDAPSMGGASTNVTVPNCNPADFAGVARTTSGGTVTTGMEMGNMRNVAIAGGAVAGLVVLAAIIADDDDAAGTTTTTDLTDGGDSDN